MSEFIWKWWKNIYVMYMFECIRRGLGKIKCKMEGKVYEMNWKFVEYWKKEMCGIYVGIVYGEIYRKIYSEMYVK